MAWTGVITNAGQALLDAWAGGGHTMTIDRAEVGSGITEAANLLTATQLAHYEAAASIIRVEAVAGGTKFKIQVAPATSEAYNATEIGIYAHIDSEASVLMALHQDPEGGVAVPTRSQSPDFAFALYCIHAISNTSQLTVNIDPNAYVSMSTFNTAITSLENSKLAKTGDAKDATVAYTSADITDSAAAYNTGWTSAGKLTSGEKFSVVLNKISTMMKNLRWIHKLIGDTDISALSTEHTIAGALSKLNTDLTSLIAVQSFTQTGVAVAAHTTSDYSFSVAKSNYTPIGVIGVHIASGYECAFVYSSISGTNANVRILNTSGASITPSGVTVVVLYKHV